MPTVPNLLSTQELEQGLGEVLASPREQGILIAIFVRPAQNQRQSLTSVELSPEGGIHGDRWATNHWQKLPDGRPDPQSQITLMNARILRLVAGDGERMSLAGDNLVIDLDLSEENLPAGTHLDVGQGVVLEMTTEAHTGCAKFLQRFGKQALQFVNGPQGKSLNLRGRYARVVTGGKVHVGEQVVLRKT